VEFIAAHALKAGLAMNMRFDSGHIKRPKKSKSLDGPGRKYWMGNRYGDHLPLSAVWAKKGPAVSI
jgi:hypothetical protein